MDKRLKIALFIGIPVLIIVILIIIDQVRTRIRRNRLELENGAHLAVSSSEEVHVKPYEEVDKDSIELKILKKRYEYVADLIDDIDLHFKLYDELINEEGFRHWNDKFMSDRSGQPNPLILYTKNVLVDPNIYNIDPMLNQFKDQYGYYFTRYQKIILYLAILRQKLNENRVDIQKSKYKNQSQIADKYIDINRFSNDYIGNFAEPYSN